MRRLVLLFPGQGSQQQGMGAALMGRYSIARRTFEEAGDLLGYDLAALCSEGDPQQLAKTEFTQPALLTAGIAAWRVFQQEVGSQAHYAAGQSLGEYTALVAAGALDLADAVQLVRRRGRYMQEAAAEGIGAMAAVSDLDAAVVERFCSRATHEGARVSVSGYNSPLQTVISGHREAVQQVAEALEKVGGRITHLSVSAPFHSPLMQPAAEKLAADLAAVTFREPAFPVIANVDGQAHGAPETIAEKLVAQMTAPVQWVRTQRTLKKAGVVVGLEFGPQKFLSRMMRATARYIRVLPCDEESHLEAAREELAPPKKVRENLLTRALAMAVSTRNSNWDEDAYRKGVVEPVRAVKTLVEELEQSGREANEAENRQALEMLLGVFETKGVAHEERRERLELILDETGNRELGEAYLADLQGAMAG